jgi:hypothetical protein
MPQVLDGPRTHIIGESFDWIDRRPALHGKTLATLACRRRSRDRRRPHAPTQPAPVAILRPGRPGCASGGRWLASGGQD